LPSLYVGGNKIGNAKDHACGVLCIFAKHPVGKASFCKSALLKQDSQKWAYCNKIETTMADSSTKSVIFIDLVWV
jgi:hypothetical protein